MGAAPTFEELTRTRLAERGTVADALADLLLAPDRWIRRRVEHIELESLEETRSEISLDVFLPPATQERLAVDDGSRFLVPLGFGLKGIHLRRFDLSVEGKPASLLSFGENAVLTAAVLARMLAREGVAVPDDGLEALCGRRGDPRAGAQLDAVVQAIAAAPADDATRARLDAWARWLRGRYVLYAAVPVTTNPVAGGGDPVVTAQRHLRFANTKPRTGAGGGGARVAADTLEALVELTDVGFAARYHLDLGVAPELRVTRAALLDGRSDREIGDAVQEQDRVALETPLAGGAVAAIGAKTFVRLALRPERRLIALEALIVSTGLLLSTLASAVVLVFDVGVPSGVPALLSAPILLSIALLARSAPDQLTRWLTQRTRLRLSVQAAVAIVAMILVLAGLRMGATALVAVFATPALLSGFLWARLYASWWSSASDR